MSVLGGFGETKYIYKFDLAIFCTTDLFDPFTIVLPKVIKLDELKNIYLNQRSKASFRGFMAPASIINSIGECLSSMKR